MEIIEPITYKGLTYAVVDLERWLPCIVTKYVDAQDFGEVLYVFSEVYPPEAGEALKLLKALHEHETSNSN